MAIDKESVAVFSEIIAIPISVFRRSAYSIRPVIVEHALVRATSPLLATLIGIAYSRSRECARLTQRTFPILDRMSSHDPERSTFAPRSFASSLHSQENSVPAIGPASALLNTTSLQLRRKAIETIRNSNIGIFHGAAGNDARAHGARR